VRGSESMISLKKHIDSWETDVPDPTLKVYRSLLAMIGDCSCRALPELGKGLQRKLAELDKGLSGHKVPPDAVADIHKKAQMELNQWAEQGFQGHEANKRDLQEIVDLMAKAVISVTERDDRYSRQFVELTEKLRAITSLNDIALIRKSIIESANSLTECVERQTEDSRASLLRLSEEVEDYRSRLDKSERLSSIDTLTGLANRRSFEELLSVKIRENSRFCLVIMDLNDFKAVNDRLGHVVGDEVLKYFAGKLRTQFPSADLVARWGGDEFAVILSTSKRDTEARVNRLRLSGVGEFRVSSGRQSISVCVEASIGVVEWDGVEQGSELVARADSSMYRGKQAMKDRR
jgi:diguanylate cyclase (GGDEF)-like protein